jgi:hypothetical protein
MRDGFYLSPVGGRIVEIRSKNFNTHAAVYYGFQGSGRREMVPKEALRERYGSWTFLAPERIKHAAVVAMNGWALMGKSHADCFHQARHAGIEVSSLRDHQGFVTDAGRYVDRKEAARIAYEADQIAARVPYLFSEDLWSGYHYAIHDYDPIMGYVPKWPRYADLQGVALQVDTVLPGGHAVYHRRCGNWSVRVRRDGDRFVCDPEESSPMRHTKGWELTPTTKEEHDRSNA